MPPVKEKAWHGLGQVVEEAMTSEEAIKQAGLDYVVEKRRIFTGKPQIEIPDKFATVRKDTNAPLGVVGSKYTILQNVDAFKFFDAIVGKGEAIFQTAGALGQGETIFITAKLPDYIKVAKDDLLEQYLFLTNTHDGSKVVEAAFTPVRIVCNNTLNMALKQCTNRVRIKHTSSVESKVQAAHNLMGIVNLFKKEMEQVMQVMVKTPIVDKALRQYIINVFATQQHQDMLAKGEELSTKFENLINDVMEYALTSVKMRSWWVKVPPAFFL